MEAEWIEFSGTFNLPMETTKAQVLQMDSLLSNYIEDDDYDYINYLTGGFQLCVYPDEDWKGLKAFLGLLKQYDMRITYLTINDYRPKEYDEIVERSMRELQDTYAKNPDDVDEFMEYIISKYF